MLEAHPVAHVVARRAATLAGHEVCGGARGDAARLEDQDVTGAGDAGVEQRRRHARRLAGAGRRAQHHPPPAVERVEHGGEQRDRWGGAPLPRPRRLG